MRTTLYTTIGVAVAALALGSATLAGQHAHSAPAGAAGSNPAHIHIGHVMTMWKDTPNTQGFLPVAVADAKVAATHAGLMQKSPDNLDYMKLHAGHVLHALDPTLEAKGPGSGYGVKRAAEGALQHIQLAAKSEGASQNIQTHAGHTSASLSDVTAWTDQAIATAQKIRAATSASEAAALVTEVIIAQTNSIANGIGCEQRRLDWLADRRRRPRPGPDSHGFDGERRGAFVHRPSAGRPLGQIKREPRRGHQDP